MASTEGDEGLRGDTQGDLRYHGGPERAVSLFSLADGKIHRINQEDHPGESRVYARVVVDGMVREGESVLLVRELKERIMTPRRRGTREPVPSGSRIP